MTEGIQVVRNDDGARYEIIVDGTVAGFTEFVADATGRLVFPHTEIDPMFGGRGLGSNLVAAAMLDVAERGESVVPVCPFVVRYLKSHEVPGLEVRWRARGLDRPAPAGAQTPPRGEGDEGGDDAGGGRG